jgi:hypothetical protein
MPTPQTIVTPLPNDARVIALSTDLNITRREALAVVVETWTWLATYAQEGRADVADIAVLDGVVLIEGAGQALVANKLLGMDATALLLPKELNAWQADHQQGSTTNDAKEAHKREQARVRKQNERAKKKAEAETSSPSKPRTKQQVNIGTVRDHGILMLAKRDGGYFYKCDRAWPPLTGSVVNPDDKSLLTAVLSLMEARKRQQDKEPDRQDFRPSLKDLAEEARRLKEESAAPSNDDTVVASETSARRDVTHVTHATRDVTQCHATVTVPGRDILNEPVSTASRNRLENKDLRHRHGSVTSDVTSGGTGSVTPSSSSTLSLNDSKKPATTSGVTLGRQPDAEDAFIESVLNDGQPLARKKTPEAIAAEERVQRIAAALDISPGSVRAQEKGNLTDVVRRLRERGYDRDGFEIKKDGDAAPGVTPPPESEEAVNSQEDVVEACKQSIVRASVASDNGDDEQRKRDLITQLETGWLAKKELQDTTAE